MHDRSRGGDERHPGDDDLVARPDSEGAQRQHQSVGARAAADGVREVVALCEVVLEVFAGGGPDEAGSLEDLVVCGVELGADRPVKAPEIEKGYRSNQLFLCSEALGIPPAVLEDSEDRRPRLPRPKRRKAASDSERPLDQLDT